MFTGLIEEVGSIAAIEPLGEGQRLVITAKVSAELTIGESIAINGVWLTVVERDGARFAVEAVRETITRTTIAALAPGAQVNLERALSASSRLGGHFVLGHIDGVGEVVALQRREPGFWLQLRVPPPISPLMVEKGSIAVEGVSLTIAEVAGEEIGIALIPHSAQRTTLGMKKAGDGVNIEADIIGKYVQRLLDDRQELRPLTGERLQEWGY